MNPAPSVILFTTLSGIGFGLLAFLGLGLPQVSGRLAFAFFFLAYLLSVGGLLASTFHLGHPERALKAFSQWRTSWLSREAWAAVSALFVMAVYGAGLIFWEVRLPILGLLGLLLSLVTVYCTSMIYAQLKTIPRWNMSLTPLLFISLSLAGGAVLSSAGFLAITMLATAGCVQIAYWVMGDTRFEQSGITMASATGLGKIGSVRAFEPPHTGTNYLLREFVYVIGRKHASKMRILTLLLMVLVPVIILLIPANYTIKTLISAACHLAGVCVSRWLFFAQAEHVVGLYYGRR
jgi:sulfite dehydrogenase (quinone) subunit SoeC